MARGRRGKGENFISSVQEMHCHFVFIFSTDVIVKEGCAATNVQGSVERRDDNMEGSKSTGFHSPVSRWLRDSHIAALPGDVATHFFFGQQIQRTLQHVGQPLVALGALGRVCNP